MKTFALAALTAVVATLSLSTSAEAGWRHHNNGWNDDYGYRIVYKQRRYHNDYCYTKKIREYDDYGNVYIKRVRYCD